MSPREKPMRHFRSQSTTTHERTCLLAARPDDCKAWLHAACVLTEGPNPMKKKFALMAGALALSAVAVTAQAQEKRNAVSLFGNITSSDDYSTANVNGTYERLVTDKLSIAVGATYTRFDFAGFDTTSLGVTAGATYYIGRPMQASNMLFYGKGIVGLTRSETPIDKDTGNTIGVFAGLEQPLSEATSLFEELGFQRTKVFDDSRNEIVFNIGLKLRF